MQADPIWWVMLAAVAVGIIAAIIFEHWRHNRSEREYVTARNRLIAMRKKEDMQREVETTWYHADNEPFV